MASRTRVKGYTGLLSIKDGAAYKPLVCLTNTSIDRSANTVDVVNYCTEGEVVSRIDGINRTVSFDAEMIDETDLGADAGYNDMVAIMHLKKEHIFKIEGRQTPKFFKATVTSLSDTFPGDGIATFSGTLNVNGKFLDSAPVV